MFIVWRKRPVTGDKRTAFLRESDMTDYDRTPWKPLHCEHRGDGRVAWTPLVMHSERGPDGKPRQKVLWRLPTIRSCCIADGYLRAAWWHDVRRTIESWQESYCEEGTYLPRDRAAILASLKGVVPRPTAAGLRDFTAFRLAKEAEREARDEADRAWWWEESERRRREREEARRATEDQWHAQNDKLWEEILARLAGSTDAECFAALDLKPGATLEEVGRRHRELVMKHHPDRGGDAKDFARVQAAYERAREILGRRAPA